MLHDGQAASRSQRCCGLAGTSQLGAVDRVDGLAGEPGGQRRGLLDALRVQRWVGGLGAARHHVGGAAVANQQHFALIRLRAAQRGLGNCLRAVVLGHVLGHSVTVAVSTRPARTRAMPTQPTAWMRSCTTAAPSSAAVMGSSSVRVMTVVAGSARSATPYRV
jgi:hypothetical protein